MNNTKNLSSFVIQPYRRKYLRDYCRRMSQDDTTKLWDDNVASVLEEQGFTIKDSPRSVYKVEKLYEALAKYAPNKAPLVNIHDEHVYQGVRLARACFARGSSERLLNLPAFTPELVYKITSNKSGSAGLTAWGQTKAESYVRAYDRGLQQIKGVKFPDPCVAFKRTQFDDKTRLVWGYPYAMTALEGIFARPLIEEFKKNHTPMAFAMPTGVLGTKLRVASYHNQVAYSTDVKSFDSSISAALIHEAFRILSTWFDLSEIEPTSGEPYGVIWEQIEHYFIHTPIFMPDGNVYKGKKHGVPSGSYFTQMIDSIVNVIMVGAISSKFSLHVDRNDIFVLGDDVLFWSNRDVSLSDISKFATSVFNAVFNEAKSSKFHYNDVIHYLGRDWKNGLPTLNEEDILIRMVQPEKFRKYPQDPEARRRAVRMLIMSYVSVYRDANRIWVKSENMKGRWFRGLDTYERDATRVVDHGVVRIASYPIEYFSGLMRYRLKYMDKQDSWSYVPLALQYWK